MLIACVNPLVILDGITDIKLRALVMVYILPLSSAATGYAIGYNTVGPQRLRMFLHSMPILRGLKMVLKLFGNFKEGTGNVSLWDDFGTQVQGAT